MLAVVQPRGHHDDILLGGVGAVQHVAEVFEIAGVAHGYQHAARAHVECAVADLRAAINAELLDVVLLSVASLMRDLLRDGEDGEKQCAESDSRHRRIRLGE